MKITAAVQTCVGGERIECSQVVNAIGDAVQIPLKILNAQQIDLSKARQQLGLPIIPGTRAAYSFISAQGELAGKMVYVLFDNEVQRPGTKDFGKLVVTVNRHVKGVDPADQWFEVGRIVIEKLEWPFNVQQDGTFTTQDSQFLLGTKTVSKS